MTLKETIEKAKVGTVVKFGESFPYRNNVVHKTSKGWMDWYGGEWKAEHVYECAIKYGYEKVH